MYLNHDGFIFYTDQWSKKFQRRRGQGREQTACASANEQARTTSKIPACRHQESLPEIRYQAIAYFLRVCAISRQIICDKFFLIENAPDQHREDERQNGESPPRTQRNGYTYHHHQHAHVHWMAHKSIKTGRYDLLICKRFDRRSSVAIFPEHEKVDEKTKRNQHVSD